MECHLAEQRRGRYISVHLEDKVTIMEKGVKLTDVVLLLTGLVTHCFILCMDRLVNEPGIWIELHCYYWECILDTYMYCENSLNDLYSVVAVPKIWHRVFCGVFCIGSTDGQREVCWCHCTVSWRWLIAQIQGKEYCHSNRVCEKVLLFGWIAFSICKLSLLIQEVVRMCLRLFSSSLHVQYM